MDDPNFLTLDKKTDLKPRGKYFETVGKTNEELLERPAGGEVCRRDHSFLKESTGLDVAAFMV